MTSPWHDEKCTPNAYGSKNRPRHDSETIARRRFAVRGFQAAHGYTPRASQDEMFLRTETRLADGNLIVGVEAPTGTGKSMQLISRAVSLGADYRRIIVATHTRSQADQYRELAEQAVRHGLADSWHVLYGSSEYLCPMRRATHGLSHVNAGESPACQGELSPVVHSKSA